MVQSGFKPLPGTREVIFDHPAPSEWISELFSKVEISTSKSVFHASYSLTCLTLNLIQHENRSFWPKGVPRAQTNHLTTQLMMGNPDSKLMNNQFLEEYLIFFKVMQHSVFSTSETPRSSILSILLQDLILSNFGDMSCLNFFLCFYALRNMYIKMLVIASQYKQ